MQRERPALPAYFVLHLHPHEVKIGCGAVRLLGVGLNPQNDAGDLQFTPRHARREKGDILAVGAKRGVGKLCAEEAQAAGPVLCDRGPPPGVEVIDKAVEEVFGGGIQRVGLGLHRFVGDGLRPPGHAPEAVPILVVDDDPETLRHLRDTLAEAGYAPLVTGDPVAVARLIRAEKPRLVLLDLMLPGTDGIELMQSVPELSDLPVIFISGYGRDETIARALEAGAEDYVVKPFSPTELTARIRAALRRRSKPVPFVLGELAIDYDRRRVTVAGRAVTLTPTEYELLRALAQGAGRILTHEDLLRKVWARRGHGKVKPKIVRAYVKRLRHRLGDDAARPAWIVNERGVGYRMPRPGEAGEP